MEQREKMRPWGEGGINKDTQEFKLKKNCFMGICSNVFKCGQLDSLKEHDCEWNIYAASGG